MYIIVLHEERHKYGEAWVKIQLSGERYLLGIDSWSNSAGMQKFWLVNEKQPSDRKYYDTGVAVIKGGQLELCFTYADPEYQEDYSLELNIWVDNHNSGWATLVEELL